MRGEYTEFRNAAIIGLELPPRARRIPVVAPVRSMNLGTTSACAENTYLKAWSGRAFRNYLRVRGEYGLSRCSSSPAKELPPRARRIPNKALTNLGLPVNYLRVRGEYILSFSSRIVELELPPRARRIPHNLMKAPIAQGTTSACAENTRLRPCIRGLQWNYLRVRGEYVPVWCTIIP